MTWILLIRLVKVAEDTRNSRDLLTWMEAKIKESKVNIRTQGTVTLS